MNLSRRIVLFALLTIAFRASTSARQVGMQFEPSRPPATLDMLWDKADLVVYGRVISTQPPAVLEHTADVKVVGRFSTLSVTEYLKTDPKVPSMPSVQVLQVGGTVRRDGQVYSTAENETPLDSLQDVVVFLTRAPVHATYVSESASASIFSVTTSAIPTVQIPSLDRQMPGLSGPSVTLSDFLTRLRLLRSRR